LASGKLVIILDYATLSTNVAKRYEMGKHIFGLHGIDVLRCRYNINPKIILNLKLHICVFHSFPMPQALWILVIKYNWSTVHFYIHLTLSDNYFGF